MNESQRYADQHRRYEVRIYPIFLRALQQQLQPVLDFIRLHQDVNPPLDLLLKADNWKIPMNRAYNIVGMLSAKRQYYQIRATDIAAGFEVKETKASPLDFLVDLWSKIFYDYSTNYAYRIENDLDDTTKEEIRTALAYSYDQQYNANQTANYIRKTVGVKIARSRAILIARTEATTAANIGRKTGAESWLSAQDQEGVKIWAGRADGRERITHLDLNDTGIPISEDFVVGGEKATFPGDVRLSAAERCNCRCVANYVSKRLWDRMNAEKSKYNFAIENIL